LTFLLCLAWSGIELTAIAIPGDSWLPAYDRLLWTPSINLVLSMELNGFAVMLAVLIADFASPPSRPRLWLYVLAVTGGVAVGTTLFWFVSQRLFTIPSAPQLRGVDEGFRSIALRHSMSRLVICSLATSVYVAARRASQRVAALRAMQLKSAADERRVLESRLSAMQSRVDPQFLVDTLARVERLSDTDAPAADRILKGLTAYLRAAIPRSGDPASSVASEVDLANAFLSISSPGPGNRLALTTTEPAIEHRARMAPMVLLPLVKFALEHRTQAPSHAEAFALDLAVRDELLQLTIRDHDTGFAPGSASEPGIVMIRERLTALYGERARLALTENEHGTAAMLEMPFERVE
jgi:sensor histidine kinase YesM